MSEDAHAALEAAVRYALHAPSIFNTQPWRWRIDGDALELIADHARQLEITDPHGDLLLISCGAALHHARVALAADGWRLAERREVSGSVLARLSLLGRQAPDPAAVALRDAIMRRRTDRRPYGPEPVSDEIVAALGEAAQEFGVGLHRVRYSQMPILSIAVAIAGANEMADPDYRHELVHWTNRPEWTHDGVPPASAVAKVPRRVPVREFAVAPHRGMVIPAGGDLGSAYLLLYGDTLDPGRLVNAGEALSAVLLTAVSRGLAVAPMTDVLEVEHPRTLIRRLLRGIGEPYAMVRCGHQPDPTEVPATPRRSLDEVVVDAHDN